MADRTIELASIDALLFDIGGVVIDVEFGRMCAKWAELSGGDADEIAARFSMDEAYEQHEVGTIDASEYFVSLRKSLDLDLSDDDMITGWTAIHAGVIDGIDEVLVAAAQRWPLYGFTNSNATHNTAATSKYSDAFRHFDTVFSSFEIGLRKPTADAFEHVAAAIGSPLERVLFFDDSPSNVDGAWVAGMPAVLVTSTDDVRRALQL